MGLADSSAPVAGASVEVTFDRLGLRSITRPGPLPRAEIARALSVTKRTASQPAAVLASAGLGELRRRDAALVAQTNAPLPADDAIEPVESFAFSADAVGHFDSAMSAVGDRRLKYDINSMQSA